MNTIDSLAYWCGNWAEFVQQVGRTLGEYEREPQPGLVFVQARESIAASWTNLMDMRANTDLTRQYSMAHPDDRARLEAMVANTIEEVSDVLTRWESWLDTHAPAPEPDPAIAEQARLRAQVTENNGSEVFGVIGVIGGIILMLMGLAAGLEKVEYHAYGTTTTNPGAPMFFLGLGALAIGGVYWLIGDVERKHGKRAANALAAGITVASLGHAAYLHQKRHEAQQQQALGDRIAEAFVHQQWREQQLRSTYPNDADYRDGGTS